MSYSRPAIQFHASLSTGDKFTPIKDYAPYAGKVIIVDGLLRHYSNPDDCMYEVKDENGNLLEPVRAWWLRKCCRRVN